MGLIEKFPKLSPARSKRFVEEGRKAKERISELLRDDGVLLLPTYPMAAPRHGFALLPPSNWVYTAIWNVMETPVTAVPMGLNKSGVPLGKGY